MKLIMTFLMSCIVINTLFAQVSLSGNVADLKTTENLIGANISIFQNNKLVTGTSTDFEGEYYLELFPGIYDMEVSYIGYEMIRVEDVFLGTDEQKELMIGLDPGINLMEVVVMQVKAPISGGCTDICCGYRVVRENEKVEKLEVRGEVEGLSEEVFTFNFYPNPTIDLMNIVLAQATASLIIRSMDGRELLQRSNLSAGIVELNVSDYPAGTYILQVLNEGKMLAEKFVVARK